MGADAVTAFDLDHRGEPWPVVIVLTSDCRITHNMVFPRGNPDNPTDNELLAKASPLFVADKIRFGC